jgi:hypothetical protein
MSSWPLSDVPEYSKGLRSAFHIPQSRGTKARQMGKWLSHVPPSPPPGRRRVASSGAAHLAHGAAVRETECGEAHNLAG